VLSGLLETLGQDPGAVLARAGSDQNKAALRAQTERAEALGIFGAPSFVVGEELYWGNDRLGDAVAKAALG
jgi:2-hydroxychromene-2-carboxylate isomerase